MDFKDYKQNKTWILNLIDSRRMYSAIHLVHTKKDKEVVKSVCDNITKEQIG